MSHTKRPLRSAAFVATLALGAATAVPAHAAYHVTAFENSLGYAQIESEDYAAASSMLRRATVADQRYAVATNLCVSQVKADDLAAAMASCERAVRAAPVDLGTTVSPSPRRRAEIMTHLYSNRGVVKALSGDHFGARDDFERALSLDPDNANARRNLDVVSAADVASQSD